MKVFLLKKPVIILWEGGVEALSAMRKEFVSRSVDRTNVRIATLVREGEGTPLLFLHGFGSTKEDYADAMLHPRFKDRFLIAYDAPGCGESECEDLSRLSIPFLTRVAEMVVDHCNLGQFHLAGHSMGGLTSLKLASVFENRILSFANIEGNVAPEDCFLSRQILSHPAVNAEEFMTAFIDRAWRSAAPSSALYASGLRSKVRSDAVAPIFQSMVHISDNEPLLDSFVGLDCPKMFVYGEQNRTLSYLETLRRRGVEMAEIPQSGHWPMYANPVELWKRMADFIDGMEN